MPTDQQGNAAASRTMGTGGHALTEQMPTGPRPSPLHTLYGDQRVQRTRAEQWLYEAATCRDVACAEWKSHGVAVLTAGIVWDAVRVPYAALDPGLERDTTAHTLRRRLDELQVSGPVFCDPYRPFLYVLVPPGTDRQWPRTHTSTGVECLGGTRPYVHHVGVPRLDRTEPPGPYWVTPPDGTGRHADPQHLYRVLSARTAETERAGL